MLTLLFFFSWKVKPSGTKSERLSAWGNILADQCCLHVLPSRRVASASHHKYSFITFSVRCQDMQFALCTAESQLFALVYWQESKILMKYNMLLFSCEGQNTKNPELISTVDIQLLIPFNVFIKSIKIKIYINCKK